MVMWGMFFIHLLLKPLVLRVVRDSYTSSQTSLAAPGPFCLENEKFLSRLWRGSFFDSPKCDVSVCVQTVWTVTLSEHVS